MFSVSAIVNRIFDGSTIQRFNDLRDFAKNKTVEQLQMSDDDDKFTIQTVTMTLIKRLSLTL